MLNKGNLLSEWPNEGTAWGSELPIEVTVAMERSGQIRLTFQKEPGDLMTNRMWSEADSDLFDIQSTGIVQC